MIYKIRFFLGLFSSKLLLFIYKIIGNSRDDKPGLLAYRFDDKFLEHLNKPKLVIGITGTNGKSTVSSILNDFMVLENKKVAYNDWFANTLAGHARCLLDAVTIFNKPRKDVAILEMDELTLPDTLPYAKVDYLIVTNICRDSIRRNAYPSFILSKIEEAINMSKDTVLILNADDPISSFVKCNNKKIYYSINKTRDEIYNYNINDFALCPKCHSKIVYDYQHYRHIGKMHCINCNFKSIKANYIINNIDYENKEIEISKYKYPILSTSIFNIFNELSVIALLKELKFNDKVIAKNMKKIKIPITREDSIKVNGIDIDLQITKGQNVAATSTIFEQISHKKENIEIVLIINEVSCVKEKTETVTYLYETDFEFLNRDNIKKIIIGSYLALDYKIAMMMAGINEDKIVIAKDEEDTVNYVTFDNIDKIMILYDVDYLTGSKKIRDKIVEKLKGERNEN